MNCELTSQVPYRYCFFERQNIYCNVLCKYWLTLRSCISLCFDCIHKWECNVINVNTSNYFCRYKVVPGYNKLDKYHLKSLFYKNKIKVEYYPRYGPVVLIVRARTNRKQQNIIVLVLFVRSFSFATDLVFGSRVASCHTVMFWSLDVIRHTFVNPPRFPASPLWLGPHRSRSHFITKLG